ncbi:MAG: right-handed parallel beta-helix repeat-containing protein, partial [Candidatus Sumerlaeia bacterium]|nr:right-handed parallel beta-helix repeat-containing protein [Candidatus Sumerlaeia bacterium]
QLQEIAALSPLIRFDDSGRDARVPSFEIVREGQTHGVRFAGDPFTVDGKTVGIYSWQWEKNDNEGQPHFMPTTVIHETGHGLGLPDLYDYPNSSGVGPPGGGGGLGMMDSYGDHNGFSKWLLGWLTPTAVGSVGVVQNLTLRPSSQYPDCAVVMQNMTTAEPFSEYYLVQNRARYNNDAGIPTDGLLIWHIMAVLNSLSNDFEYDNSWTTLKLVRLMEADGLEEIGNGDHVADAGDFYLPGSELTPLSKPSSQPYGTFGASVHVQNIGGGATARTVSLVIATRTIADGVDTTTLAWTTGGSSVWFGEQASDATGLDDVRSGPIGHGQNTWLRTTVADQGTLRFDWKVSSEANRDYLEFSIDGALKDRISGSVGWQTKSYLISASGNHTLQWRYVKDASGSAGTDRAWLDNVHFTPAIPLGKAVDNEALIWTAGGDAGWYGQSAQSFFGGDAARSAPISNNQYAGFQTTLSEAGTVSFYWKVSSQANSDWLEFCVNGLPQDHISGNVDWQQKSVYIGTPGASLRWRYVKDGAGSAGSDCGWVDKVEFVPGSPLAEATDNAYTGWQTSGSGLWYWQSATSYFGGDAARSGSTGHGQTSTLRLVSPGGGPLGFYYKVSSQQDHDWLEIWIDGVMKDRISGETDWLPRIYTVQLGSQIEWRYVKDGSVSAGEDCGWVDRVMVSDGSLATALDCATLGWITDGSLPWFSQTTVKFYGASAARSGAINHNQESRLSSVATGPGVLGFYWKASSEHFSDELTFSVDGVERDAVSGDIDWQSKIFVLGPGTHSLLWQYKKDPGFTSGEDAVWLDYVTWQPVLTLGEAVEQPALTWSTYGGAGWTGEGNLTAYGLDAARSGAIPHNQSSYLETSLSGAGTVRFYWAVSSEASHDYLEFYLDNVLKDKISGTVNWQQKSYLLGPDAHMLRWIYYKDAAGTAGMDAAWVDRVEIIANPSLGEAVDNTSLTWATSGNAVWLGQTMSSYSGGDAAQSGDIGDGQQSVLQTTVAGPGLVRFCWKVSSQADSDFLEFWIDNAVRCKISGTPDWERRAYTVGDGPHTLKWRYVKNPSFTDYLDCGWVDKVEWIPGAVVPSTLRVPQDYGTIQSAINASLDGGTIIVAPGRYCENIDFKNKALTLRSTDPANPSIVATTIIDGNNQGPAVTFRGWEGSSCILSGFKITNGKAKFGGGICGNGTTATIQNCQITSNTAPNGSGAGLWACNGLIQNNLIYRNRAEYGAAFHLCNGVIQNNLIYNNTALQSGGAMMWCHNKIHNNTLYGNTAAVSAGGLILCNAQIRNCILWGNTAPSGAQLTSSPAITYSCIQGWTGGGTGNFATNPNLTSPAGGDFHLRSNSPCIDAGCAIAGLARDYEGSGRPLDAVSTPRGDGSNYDIGADEYSAGPAAVAQWERYR